MGIVTTERLKALNASAKVLFQEGLETPVQWKGVAMEVKSNAASNVYAWLNKFPTFREWIGERQLKSIKASSYELTNKKFEASVSVDRTDLEDDNMGIYAPLFKQMGSAANEHIDILVFGALLKGFTEKCYDGKPFFSTAHPYNTKTDGTGEDKTQSNIINPTVTSKSAWFVLDTSKPFKPLIYQNRKPATLQVVDAEDNETVFMRDQYIYGARARRAGGVSLPQLAVACRDELTAANFEKAVAALRSMMTDGNRPLNAKATTLVVSPDNEAAADKIINALTLANGASNTNYHKVEIIVTPYILPDVIDDIEKEKEPEPDTETQS